MTEMVSDAYRNDPHVSPAITKTFAGLEFGIQSFDNLVLE
jgi:hypothetical protein